MSASKVAMPSGVSDTGSMASTASTVPGLNSVDTGYDVRLAVGQGTDKPPIDVGHDAIKVSELRFAGFR